MDPQMTINLGLALIGLIALLLILVLKELRNLSSRLEQSQVSIPAKMENYQPSVSQGVSEEEVAAIVAVITKLMPGQKIASIRMEI
jgi:Na+-transporting methylmalonyl-CoA/oxaloacetate decarboxylase gamma subunit